MSETLFRTLVWLSYRLAATFAFGVPIILIAWSISIKETSITKYLSIYWKVSSLFFIGLLLLISKSEISYLISFISSILIITSLWFWVDINEELNAMPINNGIGITTKIWRWSLSIWCLLFGSLHLVSFNCITSIDNKYCSSWIELPSQLNEISTVLIKFLLGGSWNESLAGFLGFVSLTFYLIGLVQWFLFKLPKQGRIAGDF